MAYPKKVFFYVGCNFTNSVCLNFIFVSFSFLFSRFNRFLHILHRLSGLILHHLMSEIFFMCVCVRYKGGELNNFLEFWFYFPNCFNFFSSLRISAQIFSVF